MDGKPSPTFSFKVVSFSEYIFAHSSKGERERQAISMAAVSAFSLHQNSLSDALFQALHY